MTPSKSGLAPNSAWSSKTRCSTSCCSPPVLRRLISRKSAELVARVATPPGVVAQVLMKKWVRVAAFAIAIGLAIPGINAARMGSRQIDVPRNDETALPIEASAQRLAQAVRFRTVSHQDASQFPVAEFDRFQAFLSETY